MRVISDHYIQDQSRVPNLFLIGAPKCGTSALAEQLSQHPDIFMGVKEPRFLDAAVFFDSSDDHPIRDVGEYLALYNSESARRARYRVDASVFIMYSADALKRMLQISPDAKVILVLRDPLDAAKSMHLQRLKYPPGPMRELSESFAECWRMLGQRRASLGYPAGCRNKFLFRYDLLYDYSYYLPEIKRIVPGDQLLCVDYAVFRSDPERVHRYVLRFLGVRPNQLTSGLVNPSYVLSTGPAGRLYWLARSMLLPVSRRMRWIGPALAPLALRFPGVRVPKDRAASEVDASVRSYFDNSSRVMQEILANYEVNQLSAGNDLHEVG